MSLLRCFVSNFRCWLAFSNVGADRRTEYSFARALPNDTTDYAQPYSRLVRYVSFQCLDVFYRFTYYHDYYMKEAPYLFSLQLDLLQRH